MTDRTGEKVADLYEILRGDIDRICAARLDEVTQETIYPDPIGLSQPDRRGLVRAVFAFVEATTYSLRQLLTIDFGQALSAEMLMALKEEQVTITASGQVRKTAMRVGSSSLIRLTFSAYAQVLKNSSQPTCDGPDFEALIASFVVRDRLMHPKSASHLVVTDTEIRKVLHGFSWMNRSIELTLRSHVNAMRERLHFLNGE